MATSVEPGWDEGPHVYLYLERGVIIGYIKRSVRGWRAFKKKPCASCGTYLGTYLTLMMAKHAVEAVCCRFREIPRDARRLARPQV